MENLHVQLNILKIINPYFFVFLELEIILTLILTFEINYQIINEYYSQMFVNTYFYISNWICEVTLIIYLNRIYEIFSWKNCENLAYSKWFKGKAIWSLQYNFFMLFYSMTHSMQRFHHPLATKGLSGSKWPFNKKSVWN